MGIKVHTVKDIVLKLTEREAVWLRGVMQNPLHSDNPNAAIEEDELSREMREMFFNSLKDIDAGYPIVNNSESLEL